MIDPKVINISKRELSNVEIRLLQKGLKFTPTPKRDTTDVVKDTDEFCRKLRLREFFHDSEYEDESLVRNNSNFKPPLNRNSYLDEYISCLKGYASTNANTNRVKDNLNKEERTAIENLRNDPTIVIKEADKGGAVVIMDRDHYKRMVMQQLLDEEFYTEISGSQDKTTMKRVFDLIHKYSDCLTKKEQDYLTKFECKSSNFYGLPKIHKSKQIQSGLENNTSSYIKLPEPTDLKLRPIIAGPACPTQRLSNLLDILLKPLCKNVPSYVRDDLDFLRFIPDTIDPDTILVSFDVVSLYTNIPHSLGIEAITNSIERNTQLIHPRFPKEFIIDGLKLVLNNNHFFFDDRYFLQIKGTAMGTKVAPTYATLVMGFLEEKLYRKIDTQYDTAFSEYIRNNWKRYLDDCFMFWSKTKEELSNFHQLLNDIHPSIQFTMDMQEEELPFLDIMIIKKDDKIITDLFYKKTDSHQYLIFNSCHPSHTKRNIPYNLARRVCTIVLEPSLRNKRLEELKLFLREQLYPKKLIDSAITKAKNIPIADLRTSKDTPAQKDMIPFVVTHNPRNAKIFNAAKQFLPILHQSPNLRNLIKPQDFIHSQRQPPNLKKLLTRAQFTSTSEETYKISKCLDPRCGTCQFILEGDLFKFKNGKTFRVNDNMSCKSKNLIYCMICPSCSEEYIGQTGTKLADRVRVHKQQIKDPTVRNTPCSAHFDNCGHGKFIIFPFYKVKSDNENLRRAKENFFINIFKPKLNR